MKRPCEVCGKEGPGRFCNNICFRKYAKKTTQQCAICDETNDITEICKKCQQSKYNKGWRSTPPAEKGGFDMDTFAAGVAGIQQSRHQAYRTPLAVRILRRIASGETQQATADALGCSIGYVKEVCRYWNQETRGLLSKLNKSH